MAIELKHVSKSFGGVHALSDVSLSFGGGKIYGLLGSNGAGKTTMLNIITNRLYADSGEVLIDGESARARQGTRQGVHDGGAEPVPGEHEGEGRAEDNGGFSAQLRP